MLITERGGRVGVALPGRNSYEPTPFLQQANVEATVGESALVNRALDPASPRMAITTCSTRGVPPSGTSCRASRRPAGPPASPPERVIFEDSTAAPDVHHGGGLVFGTDGRLYIAVGDGQDSSAGTVRRLAPTPHLVPWQGPASQPRRQPVGPQSVPLTALVPTSTRFGPSACAIPSACRSTRSPAGSTSTTSVRTCGKRLTSCPAAPISGWPICARHL